MHSVLEFDEITKKYGYKPVLQEISMAIPRGVICGLVGANGAGKTTMMKIAVNLISPNSGTVKLNLKKKGNTGILIDYPVLDKGMSVRRNIEAHCKLCGFSPATVDDSIKYWGIADFSHKKVGRLSTGMKQKTALLLAFMGEPEFIILDEPANGLDPHGVKDLREKIVDMNQKYGTTFLISSHIIDELVKVASQCILLKDGKITFVEAETSKIEEAYFDSQGVDG